MNTLTALCSALILLALSAAASAQTVSGTITERASGDPVVGAFVVLVDSAGARRAGVLTGPDGGYVVGAPGPGRYRIRIERIGFATVTTAPLTLRKDEAVRRSLAIGEEPIALEGIRAEAEPRCRVRPEEGLAVARVWDEARKALAVATWTEEERAPEYRVETYARQLDPEDLRVLEETRAVRIVTVRGSPFRSLPAGELARRGYVYPDSTRGNQYVYNAPDAAALLSDVFLDTHCFQLATAREGEADRIGLSFRPIGGRDVVDVAGTLWLDRESAELRAIEFGYVNLPWRLDRAHRVGGRVEFERLETGEWIVRRWRIRMPTIAYRQPTAGILESTTRRPIIAELREVGGEVLEVHTAGAEILAAAARATLRGVVWDSTRAEPLAGAVVYISGTSYRDTADARGRFRMRGLPAGSYAAGYLHARLDSLGVIPETAPVQLRRGEVTHVRLAVPTRTTIANRACAEIEETRVTGPPAADPRTAHIHRGEAVLVGRVRDAGAGVPLPDARVYIRWNVWSTAMQAGRVVRESRVMEVRPDAAGRFRACNLPEDVRLHAWAEYLDLSSDTVSVRLAPEEVRRIDLAIDPSRQR